MPRYYRLSCFREPFFNERWEHICVSVDERGRLRIVCDDRIGVKKTRLEEVSEEESRKSPGYLHQVHGKYNRI